MVKRIALVLLASSAPALAQPSGPTTPTYVATIDPSASLVAPWIARKGNLRLSISCAESWTTPDDGLALTVDGAPLLPRESNGSWGSYVDNDGNSSDVWNSSDTGYLLAPGHHHVEIDVPGCARSEFDMDAFPDHAQHAIGRLAVSDSELQGPVGAPNGMNLTLGLRYGAAPRGPASSFFQQTATFDPGYSATGGELSIGFERRHLATGFDIGFSTGVISGTVSSIGTNTPVTQQFTGTAYTESFQYRVGGRMPLNNVALIGGSGIGVQVWQNDTQLLGNQTQLFTPSTFDGSFYLPVWAGATFKPTCDWGVQVIGQYDLHPTSMDTNGFELMGGVMYQPSASCSEPAGVRVSTN